MMFENNIQNYLEKNGFGAIHLKAVLFDMDGVLFNSMPWHTKAWHTAAQYYGFELPIEEVYEMEGRTAKSTVDILTMRTYGRESTPQEVEEIYARKVAIYHEYERELLAKDKDANILEKLTPPMEGAFELLQKLKKGGYQIILVTGSSQTTLINRLNYFYPDVFKHDTMVTAKNVTKGKPHPEPYLKGLHFAQVKPWEAIVVENAPLGVAAGKAANIFTVALNTGPMPDERLLTAGADILFHSMKEFNDQWEQLARLIS